MNSTRRTFLMRFDQNKHPFISIIQVLQVVISRFHKHWKALSRSVEAGTGKLPEEERCKQNENWRGAPEMSTFPLPISTRTWCKFSYFTNSTLTLGIKFIFMISLMHTLSDKVRFVQRKLKPEEYLRSKNGWSFPSTFWHRFRYPLKL